MINKIIECENRLLQDRKMLNDLLQEYQAGNRSEIIRMKIDAMQREIDYMNQQVGVLRMEYHRYLQAQAAAMQPQQVVQPQPAPAMQNPQPAPAMQNPQPAPAMQNPQPASAKQNPQPQWQGAPVNPAIMQQRQGQKKKDVEETIGKSLMGIFASVLIFFSLILFATIVVPDLTDDDKMMLMFLVSFALAILGNWLLIKNPKNKWFLSLTGCGVGAVYLSFFISRIYFNAIMDLTLYICILVWAILVCVLSRLRSQIFLVIGQSGVVISVLFGVIYCNLIEDGNWVLLLVCFFFIAEAVFYFSHVQKEYGKNLLNHIFMAVCLMLLLFVTNQTYIYGEMAGMIASVLVTVLALVFILMGIFFFRVSPKDSVAFGILNVVYYFIATISFSAHFHKFGIIMAVVIFGILAILELRFPENKEQKPEGIAGKRIFQIALFLFLFREIAVLEFVWDYSAVAVPAILFLLYGFIKQKAAYKIAGFVYAFICLLIPIDGIWYGLWGGAIVILIVALLNRFKEQYQTWMKGVSYPFFLVYLIVNIARIMDKVPSILGAGEQLIVLTILATINICMMKIPLLRKNPKTGQEEMAISIETGIIHILQMLLSLGYVRWIEQVGWHWFAILLGMVLFLVNVQNVLKRFNSRWSSLYVGTKMFVFLLIVLDSFTAPDFLFSIVALVFAIAFIATGFYAEGKVEKNFKPIRIYGLVLSLLSIVKLILLDIHHDHVLSLAVSFFISGILCFAISFIYNLVDKKVTKK